MKYPKTERHQQGATLLQVALFLGVSGVIAALGYQRFNESQEGARNIAAFDEVAKWLGEMTVIGAVRSHNYTGVTHTTIVGESAIDDTINVYGLAITAGVTGGNLRLTYNFPAQDNCQYVLERIETFAGLAGSPAPACAANGTLTATVE